MSVLSKEDLMDFDALKNINLNILNGFHKLRDLEFMQKQEDPEYTKVLEKIKRLVPIEENIITRLASDPRKCDALIDYIKKYLVNMDLPKYSIVVSKGNLSDDEIIYIYLANRLNCEIFKHPDYLLEQQIAGISIFTPEEIATLSENMAYKVNLELYLNRDSLSLLLALLKRRKIQLDSPKIVKTLLEIIYNIGFTIPSIREELFYNNFHIDLNPYLIYQTVGMVNKQPNNFDDEIRNNNLSAIALSQLVTLSEFDDITLLEPKNLALALGVQAHLRALIILLDTNALTNIINKIETTVADLEKKEGFEITKLLIDEMISNIIKDRSIPQIITIGRR